jgi:manganese/iron transport system ATP-binding protein/manganese/zinc/iron transport system ATP- binding protein
MTQPVSIAVESLEAGYVAGRPAISEVEFRCEGGRIVSVLGPNGGGKTTLFRALMQEMSWQRGTVEVRGEMAYVPQTERSRLDFPVNALDVALMGTYPGRPAYRRIGGAERARAEDALERVGLADRAKHRFGELSGGQRQRVLIARALARSADVLLLDEPLSGVDERSSARILTVMRQLRDEGRTLLVAMHDLRQAREFDAVLCLNRVQVAYGEPAPTLTPSVVSKTYGGDLIRLDGGSEAILVDHHPH